MNTQEIYYKLMEAIESATNSKTGEVKIVEDAINKIKELSWGPNITV